MILFASGVPKCISMIISAAYNLEFCKIYTLLKDFHKPLNGHYRPTCISASVRKTERRSKRKFMFMDKWNRRIQFDFDFMVMIQFYLQFNLFFSAMTVFIWHCYTIEAFGVTSAISQSSIFNYTG